MAKLSTELRKMSLLANVRITIKRVLNRLNIGGFVRLKRANDSLKSDINPK